MMLQTENFSVTIDFVAKKRSDQGLTVAIRRELMPPLALVTAAYQTDKKNLITRLVEWFTNQPPAIQRVVMNLPTDGLQEPIAVMLEEMARDVRAGKLNMLKPPCQLPEPLPGASSSDGDHDHYKPDDKRGVDDAPPKKARRQGKSR